jgi:lactoylglutathione lyase
MKFCWVTINVKDMASSVRFYRDILGLNEKRRLAPNPDLEIVFLGSGETQVELIRDSKTNAPEFGKDISLGFVVDSVERFGAMLTEKNIPIHAGPFQPNPSIKFIYVLDPNGVRIQLVENIR